MPLQLGDQNPTVRQWRHVMNARFGGLYTRLHGPLGDTDQYGPRAVSWQQEYQRRTQQVNVDGVVSDNDLRALGIPLPVRHVYFSVCGTGVAGNVGYCYDIGQALNQNRWMHQWVGYPATAFPMKPSYTAGVTELVRLMGVYQCDRHTWGFGSYSQGAIVTSIVLQRVLTGDLQQYRSTFIGGITFGNPCRELQHTFPGSIDNGGQGIVTPNLVNTPASVWDMADDKAMANSPGNDLYTKTGIGGTDASVTDMRAVWDIVNSGNPLHLADALAMLLIQPSFTGGYGAAEAAFAALDFFVAEGITPHTSYQFVQPIPNDPRDCWRVALDHMIDIGNATTPR